MDTYDYDIYEYFGELEYGSDSYWDANMRHLKEVERPKQTGSKRKRGDVESDEQRSSRKRKAPNGQSAASVGDSQIENVVYMPFEARLPPSPPQPEKQSFALLPDWKQRFTDNEEDKPPEKAMPPDMRRAVEGRDDEMDTPADTRAAQVDRSATMDDAEEDWEDEDEHAGVEGLDPAMLQTILKQKLLESGLGDVDESMFSQAIASMLSGSGDDATGELADMLLGKANQDGDSALSGWLSQQGVRMEDEEGENESVAHEQLPDADDTSPPDSAVGMTTQKQGVRSHGKDVRAKEEASEGSETNDAAVASNALAGASSQAGTSIPNRKRKAQATQGNGTDEKHPAKRRQSSAAAPPPSEQDSGPSASAGIRTQTTVSARGRK